MLYMHAHCIDWGTRQPVLREKAVADIAGVYNESATYNHA